MLDHDYPGTLSVPPCVFATSAASEFSTNLQMVLTCEDNGEATHAHRVAQTAQNSTNCLVIFSKLLFLFSHNQAGNAKQMGIFKGGVNQQQQQGPQINGKPPSSAMILSSMGGKLEPSEMSEKRKVTDKDRK